MTKYVFLRPSGYYFRYVIPKAYRHLLSQRELRYPLGTHERRTATRRARGVLHLVENTLVNADTRKLVLNSEQIRKRVSAYVQEQVKEINDSWLERENASGSSDETLELVLADLLEVL